jgi:hypothetical protein
VSKLFSSGKTKLFPSPLEQGVCDILKPTKNYMTMDAKTVEDRD